MMAPSRPHITIVRPCVGEKPEVSMVSLTVWATFWPSRAPTKFITAARMRAMRGVSARVDTEVRSLVDEVTKDLKPARAHAVRRASVSRLPDLGDRLDKALAGTDLGAEKLPAWAGLVRVLQWLLIGAAVVGGLWLALLALGAYARVPEPPTPEWGDFPLPTLLLLGGVGLGILLALLCRVLVAATARRRARVADERLRTAIGEVSDELVVAPVRAELAAYSKTLEGLATALR